MVSSLKLQYTTKGCRHSPLFRKGHKITPLSFYSLPKKIMLSYFHGQYFSFSFATLKRRRGVHVWEGCLVKKGEIEVSFV